MSVSKPKLLPRPSQKNGSAISAAGDGATGRNGAVSHGQAGLPGLRYQPTCYRYKAKLDAENEVIADWLVRLKNNQRTWGFGLCFLYLRNVKCFRWNHKRVYRIYRELELNMRIKPRHR
jgi:hypothetical protein